MPVVSLWWFGGGGLFVCGVVEWVLGCGWFLMVWELSGLWEVVLFMGSLVVSWVVGWFVGCLVVFAVDECSVKSWVVCRFDGCFLGD